MTVISNIKIGQVVRSKTGRDAGKYFVVIGKENQYVFLADGDMRRVEAPKKKNIKHIQVTGCCLPMTFLETADKSLSNGDIRRGLSEIIERIDLDPEKEVGKPNA